MPTLEAERLEALRVLAPAGSARTADFEAIVRTARALFGMPIALVSLVEAEAQRFVARVGVDFDGTPRAISFCTHAIQSDAVLVIPDTHRDPRFRDSPLVTHGPRIRFYAGAPLIVGPGLRVGTLCVADTRPRRFTAAARARLQDLAQVVVAQLKAGRSERAARESAANFRLLAQNTTDMITLCDLDGTRIYVSPASESLLGYGPDELVGTRPLGGVHPDDAPTYARLLQQVKAGDLTRAVTQQRYRHKSGGWVWVEVSFGLAHDPETGLPSGYVATVRDIALRKAAEERMAHMAHHDPLTGLPNRAFLDAALDRAIERARLGEGFGLLCLDLDRFKQVNDTLGHPAGDALLRAVAERLRGILRAGDTIARLGGDEFVVLQAECGRPQDAAHLAERLIGALERPIDVDGHPVVIGVSVGIARAPGDGIDRRALLAEADRALYAAKAAGRNTFRFAGDCAAVPAEGVPEPAAAPAGRPCGSDRAEAERLGLILRAGRMVAWEHDLRTGLSTQSENAADVLGADNALGAGFFARVHAADQARLAAFFDGSDGQDHMEFRYQPPEGAMRWLRSCAEKFGCERIVGITYDITDRKLAEERAWLAAHHDPLTGLPNRRLFRERLDASLAAAARNGTALDLLIVDLDMFRDVNDTIGHDAGDAILVEAARRIAEGLGPDDLAARLGGDEFALLLGPCAGGPSALARAEALRERLGRPFADLGRILTCRASVGLAGLSHRQDGSRNLMKDAHAALFRAKTGGRDRVTVFTPEMRAETERRVGLGSEIRAALAAGRIVPFYQPKVCLKTGRVDGFEALARWIHPEHGVLTPGVFCAAFEDPELANALGASLVGQVAADLRAWRDLAVGRVAVNLASAEFRNPDLAERILGTLRAFEVPPSQFELEVTETVFLGAGAESVPTTLRRLHDSGILVTLDDFGTGYASLTHLKQFPVGHIKVDQSFVRNLEQDRDDAAIVAAVIGLGRSLGMQVTAEGVETAGQAERLRALGCDYAQGYHYAKPMPGSRVPAFLASRRQAPLPRRLRRSA